MTARDLDPPTDRTAPAVSERPDGADEPDLRFWFDPVCPFAWMTSKWVRLVQEQRDYTVEWRFISLRLVNARVDYDAHFPEGYEAGHTAGLRLLRVCERTREQHGPDAVARLYRELGTRIWDSAPLPEGPEVRDTPDFLLPALEAAGLPAELSGALEEEARDLQIRMETDEALALTGKDVGTPILHVAPPHGAAFFGPVISRLPDPEEAVELWEHVVGLATFPGFAELKRSLRERPQLQALGVEQSEVGMQEDWHGGSRRLKK